MPSSDFSAEFLAIAAESNKQLIIAIEIDGSPAVLTSGTIYSRINYGDPGIVYGMPGLVYGGLIESQISAMPLLNLDKSSLSIQQKVEPIQGRSSVSLMTLAFIDLNGFMTQLLSPGILIPDIMGAECVVRLGFPQISYPNEYAIIMRGRVSQATVQSGLATLQLSDPGIIRRQSIFYMAQTYINSPAGFSGITSTSTTVPVYSVANFTQAVLSPDGVTYDPAIKTYITIDDEVIEYGPLSIDVNDNQFIAVTRGARGTTAVAHDQGATVTAVIEVQDKAIVMALKLMLSGWGGPYLSDLPILAFVTIADPIVPNQPQGILINQDAVQIYGAAVGDWLYITDATNSANNGPCQIVLFLDVQLGDNYVIVTNKTFIPETGSLAQFAIRSQYDTYPFNLGVQMPGYEVDVARHQYIENTFFGSDDYSLSFFKTEAESSAKTFIESEIFLPFGCYSLTRRGQLSMQLTHPPLGNEMLDLQVLDKTNVLNPQNINPTRGLNNRYFYNEIDLTYDYDDSGTPHSQAVYLDTNSLNIIGVSSVLPVTAEGLKSALTNPNVINGIYNYILSRYTNGAILINLDVNFGTGVNIESGDIVEINDDGFLQIANFLTGQRNLGTQLFEVVDRTLNLVTGKCSIQVVSGIGAGFNSRFGAISPSSNLVTGTTQSLLVLTDSFGNAASGQEASKWSNYLGQGLIGIVHDVNYVQSATCVLNSMNAASANAINISGISIPASAGPFPGWILDIANYSAATSSAYQQPFKTAFSFIDPSVTAVSGISPSAFTVASSAIGFFQVGLPVLVHNIGYSYISTECIVSSVNTGTNTVAVSGVGFVNTAASAGLPFTPSAGNIVELIGFADAGQPYRII